MTVLWWLKNSQVTQYSSTHWIVSGNVLEWLMTHSLRWPSKNQGQDKDRVKNLTGWSLIPGHKIKEYQNFFLISTSVKCNTFVISLNRKLLNTSLGQKCQLLFVLFEKKWGFTKDTKRFYPDWIQLDTINWFAIVLYNQY